MTPHPDPQWSAESVARLLLDAEASRTGQSSIQAKWPGLDTATAYEAQDIALRIRKERGERVVGVKLGVTSRAKQQQVGVDTPSTSWLTDAMILPAGAAVPRDALIQPRVEPEIGFIMGERLQGPGVSAAEALAAVSHVFGAIEVIDSRFTAYGFTMTDVVADNASSAKFLTGPVLLPPTALDLSLEAVLLEVDGEIVDSATGAAVYGHPAEALAFAANNLALRGLALEPGWLVLTGGMTDAVPVRPGSRYAAHFTNLGSLSTSGG